MTNGPPARFVWNICQLKSNGDPHSALKAKCVPAFGWDETEKQSEIWSKQISAVNICMQNIDPQFLLDESFFSWTLFPETKITISVQCITHT